MKNIGKETCGEENDFDIGPFIVTLRFIGKNEIIKSIVQEKVKELEKERNKIIAIENVQKMYKQLRGMD